MIIGQCWSVKPDIMVQLYLQGQTNILPVSRVFIQYKLPSFWLFTQFSHNKAPNFSHITIFHLLNFSHTTISHLPNFSHTTISHLPNCSHTTISHLPNCSHNTYLYFTLIPIFHTIQSPFFPMFQTGYSGAFPHNIISHILLHSTCSGHVGSIWFFYYHT